MADRHHPRQRARLRGRGYFRRLGPGLVTGAADDDPSGIGTYSQVGASTGPTFLWAAPVLLPLAFAVQETCARLALASGTGLAALIRRNFPRPVLYVTVLAVIVANVVNIAADLASMAAALHLVIPIPYGVGVVMFAVGIGLAEIFVPYHVYSRILRWLCLSLLAYVASLFVIGLDWGETLKAVVMPRMSWSRESFTILIALAGTTISPYLFFWQAAEETEEVSQPAARSGDARSQDSGLTGEHIRAMRVDVLLGMFSAVAIMFAIMATTAGTLHVAGVTDIGSAEQAAQALEPLAGPVASVLFLLGIVGTGLLAVPVLAGSTAYAVAESLHWREGLERKPLQARGFYGVLIAAIGIALVIVFLGVNPMHFLFVAAVLNGLVTPLLLALLWWMARDRRIVGDWRSPAWSRALLGLTLVLLTTLPVLWLLAP